MKRPPPSGSASAQGARRRSGTDHTIALDPGDHAALTDEVARFEAAVRDLALAAVRAIVEQELERRSARQPRGRPSARTEDRTPAATRPQEPAGPAASPAADSAPSPAGGSSEATPGVPSHKRKRVPWTRETIVSELATWMLSGTAIDAAFVARYGPPGLVAAARRIFGRFEAALNVAGLHASKIAPEEPPAR